MENKNLEEQVGGDASPVQRGLGQTLEEGGQPQGPIYPKPDPTLGVEVDTES